MAHRRYSSRRNTLSSGWHRRQSCSANSRACVPAKPLLEAEGEEYVAILVVSVSDDHSITTSTLPHAVCWVNLKADSHIACCAHAVPLRVLECVFPFWFTQCSRVWFTLSCNAYFALMPCSYHALLLKGTAQHGRRETAGGLPAQVRLLPTTTRSSTKIVIRSIPIHLTTIHTYDCKEW